MITIEDIERWRSTAADHFADIPSEKLLRLVNWFAEGEVTELSNHIMEKIQFGGRLEHGIAAGCRCLSCYEWQIVDDEGQVVDSAETLWDFIKR